MRGWIGLALLVVGITIGAIVHKGGLAADFAGLCIVVGVLLMLPYGWLPHRKRVAGVPLKELFPDIPSGQRWCEVCGRTAPKKGLCSICGTGPKPPKPKKPKKEPKGSRKTAEPAKPPT